MLSDAFEDRVLPFDSDAARAYGHIAAAHRRAGRRVASADCQIAGGSPHEPRDAQRSRC